ncbi:hypothetical protein AMECASPLE_027295 [Ameca splendens]|uniref:Uncharacterized protein n=1 Tax=Ameca splendens TaxID=208324 RepID=A0ABV0ZQ06_9TELE
MLPACLHSGVLGCTKPDRMFLPKLELADGRQESSSDHWLQQQMKKGMNHLPSDLEVVSSPLCWRRWSSHLLVLHGRGVVDLFTFLSREAEKTLRRSAGLSVPQSAYDGSRLAIPCPETGPLSCRLSSPPLHTAVKPLSSSRRKKRRRGAPSCVSASEEESPTAAAARQER